MNDLGETFEVGDVVVPLPEHSYYFDNLGGLSEYTIKKIVREYGDFLLYFEGFDGRHCAYSYRVRLKKNLDVPISPYAKVISKIRNMDNRRKQLGYKW